MPQKWYVGDSLSLLTVKKDFSASAPGTEELYHLWVPEQLPSPWARHCRRVQVLPLLFWRKLLYFLGAVFFCVLTCWAVLGFGSWQQCQRCSDLSTQQRARTRSLQHQWWSWKKTHTQFDRRNYQAKSKNSISYFLLRAKVIAACDILSCKVSERVWHASLLNINMDGQNTFICEISEESYKRQIKLKKNPKNQTLTLCSLLWSLAQIYLETSKWSLIFRLNK